MTAEKALQCVSQSYRQRQILSAEQKHKEAVIDKKKQDKTRIEFSN